VARQDPVPDRAALEGKAHVGAAVVHGVDLTAQGEQGQGMPLDVDGQAAGGLNIRQAADPDKPGGREWLGHGRFSSSLGRGAFVTVSAGDG
jgi:hypothetical protein